MGGLVRPIHQLYSTGAADLKFLQNLLQLQSGTSNRSAAPGSIFTSAPDFPKFVQEVLRGFTNFGKGALADHSAPAAMALSRHVLKVNDYVCPNYPKSRPSAAACNPPWRGPKSSKRKPGARICGFPFKKTLSRGWKPRP